MDGLEGLCQRWMSALGNFPFEGEAMSLAVFMTKVQCQLWPGTKTVTHLGCRSLKVYACGRIVGLGLHLSLCAHPYLCSFSVPFTKGEISPWTLGWSMSLVEASRLRQSNKVK